MLEVPAVFVLMYETGHCHGSKTLLPTVFHFTCFEWHNRVQVYCCSSRHEFDVEKTLSIPKTVPMTFQVFKIVFPSWVVWANLCDAIPLSGACFLESFIKPKFHLP